MQVLTLKKPQYLGTEAQVIAAMAEAQVRGGRHAERTKAARAAVGQHFLNRDVKIVRIGGLRHVLVDENGAADLEIEASAVIRYAGADGGIVLSLDH